MDQPEDLVIIHHAGNPTEAELIRAILDEAGIFAVVPDRNMPLPGILRTPYEGGGVAGCEVCVRRQDAEAAKSTIAAARQAGKDLDTESGEGESSDDGGNGGE